MHNCERFGAGGEPAAPPFVLVAHLERSFLGLGELAAAAAAAASRDIRRRRGTVASMALNRCRMTTSSTASMAEGKRSPTRRIALFDRLRRPTAL
uniref:Uncharacterized protein n=1 Tax=Plectus sambesii TaxID=2011161 RepID=A0A914WIP9_9BILA